MALDLQGEMLSAWLAPDVNTYDAAISACGKSQRWQTALDQLSGMRGAWLASDVIIYSDAISACGKSR